MRVYDEEADTLAAQLKMWSETQQEPAKSPERGGARRGGSVMKQKVSPTQIAARARVSTADQAAALMAELQRIERVMRGRKRLGT